MNEAEIRLFGRTDESAVRRIGLDAGRLPDEKRPEDWLFQDYWTRYYTRIEPEHTWVSAREGEVSGYLTAAFDTERFRQATKRRILPRLLLKSAFSGALGEAKSREFLLRRIAMWAHLPPDPGNLLQDFPAHLHMNLEPTARREGTGRRLLEACLARAGQEGVAGIHLETMPENEGARRFFKRAGFSEIGERYPFEFIDPAKKDRAVLLLGRKV